MSRPAGAAVHLPFLEYLAPPPFLTPGRPRKPVPAGPHGRKGLPRAEDSRGGRREPLGVDSGGWQSADMSNEHMVTVREGAQAFVLEVVGEIDADTVEALEEGMDRAWEAGAPVTVVDLSRIRFADSSLLNLLLEAQARYTAAGRRLAVAGPFHDAVRRLFDITGTAAHLPLTEDARTAVRQAAADTDSR